LIEFLLGSLNLDKTWTRDFYLRLDTNSTHEEEFEIEIRKFLDMLSKILNRISFISIGVLINQSA
jgi:hypothetical protein